MDKRGISTVVAAVLIVLIVIVGVGVVWMIVLPIANELDIEPGGQAVSISTQGGYTLYDEIERIACVQVKKENEKAISGLKFLFTINGNSHPYTINNSDNIPEFGEEKDYCFDLANYGVPTKVSVSTLPEYSETFVSDAILPIRSLVPTFVNDIRQGTSGPDDDGLLYLDDDVVSPATFAEISECGELGEYNMTYVLQGDISDAPGTCFTITNDSITLDLGDHVVDGSGFGNGVSVDSQNNVVIVNGEIVEFDTGIYLSSSSFGTVTNITANFNNYGFFVNEGGDNTLRKVEFCDNLIMDVSCVDSMGNRLLGLYIPEEFAQSYIGSKKTEPCKDDFPSSSEYAFCSSRT